MTESEPRATDTCPACDSNDVDDSIEALHGVCEDCGFVVREDTSSISVEWEITEGAFERPEDKDWLSECRVRNGTEQQLAQAFKILEDFADRFDLSDEIREETADLYCDAFRMELTDGRDTACIVAACLYLTSRRVGISIPMNRITAFSEVDETEFHGSYLALSNDLDIEPCMPKPVEYVPFLVSELGLTDADLEAAKQLVNVVEEEQAFVGKDPTGIAAGGVYVLQGHITQSEAARAVGLSTETVRQRAKQLQRVLDLDNV